MDLAAVPYLKPAPPVERPPVDDPEYVRASAWLARAPEDPRALVLGAPFGGGSISRARCDLAPAAIRAELARFSIWNSDRAVSLDPLAALDAGDIEPDTTVEETQRRIGEAVAALTEQAHAPLVLLGGDNSVTAGGALGVGADALLTFDAHHDCRDPSRGPTNGSVVRQLFEGGITRVAQIGIHGFSNAEPHARWALDNKIHSIGAAKVRADGVGKTVAGAMRFLGRAERIWVDFDVDVLDRAFAPGAPASSPGGLSPVELVEAAYLLGREPRVAGIDITEIDPTMDVASTTVRTACLILLSFFAGVVSR